MKIEGILKEHKKSCTPERIELFTWMEKRHLFTSGDLEARCSHIGRASIFRTLKLFTEL
jgi:Fe2+ or Zn2+ uptake regulation protein